MRWDEFARLRPDLASAGTELLYQFGVGLAFLATIRADGGPRAHPVCPVLTDEGLFAFIVPSPKREDLDRDGRYWLHSFPADQNEDAFSVRGIAARVDDREVRTALTRRYIEERPDLDLTPDTLADQALFEFDVEGCLLTRTTGHGDPRPTHVTWRSSEVEPRRIVEGRTTGELGRPG
jgi:hypothetical protein